MPGASCRQSKADMMLLCDHHGDSRPRGQLELLRSSAMGVVGGMTERRSTEKQRMASHERQRSKKEGPSKSVKSDSPPSTEAVHSGDLGVLRHLKVRRRIVHHALRRSVVLKSHMVDLPSHQAGAAVLSSVLDACDPAVQYIAFAQQGHTVHHQWTGETQRNVIAGPGGRGIQWLHRGELKDCPSRNNYRVLRPFLSLRVAQDR